MSGDQGNILINTSDSVANNNSQLIAALKMQSKQKGKAKQSQLNKSLQQK